MVRQPQMAGPRRFAPHPARQGSQNARFTIDTSRGRMVSVEGRYPGTVPSRSIRGVAWWSWGNSNPLPSECFAAYASLRPNLPAPSELTHSTDASRPKALIRFMAVAWGSVTMKVSLDDLSFQTVRVYHMLARSSAFTRQR